MSRYRRNCLIIAIACFVISGWLLCQMANAETSAEIYGIFYGGNELGFSDGPGVRAEAEWWPVQYASIHGYGQYAWTHKTPHDSGHHEWYGGSLRAYPWRDLFIGGGCGYSGY